jgi:hypothetical protein
MDESQIDRLNFNAYTWCHKTTKRSLIKKSITPRITLVVAVETLGNIYASLS